MPKRDPSVFSSLFDLEHTIARPLLERVAHPWEALDHISAFILSLGPSLDPERFEQRGENIWIARSATVAPSACLTGPLIVDEEAEIRHCAFLRGNAIVGKNAVVGNSTELKNVILFDRVQVPHYNYVGDSILGYKAHMGAGAITSNVKSDKTPVSLQLDGERIPTGRKKLGALLGDEAEIGCGSVLCPGAVIGRGSQVYPLSMVRGTVPAASIYKHPGEIVRKR